MSFRVVLDGVTLRDWSWSATHVGYFPPVRGVAVELHDVEVSSWKMMPATAACKPPACEQTALERRFKVNPGVENMLALVADTTGATVVSKTSKDTTWDCFTQGGNPASNDTHIGGWTVSAGASGGGFCSTTERLPNLVDGFAAKLTAGPAVAALRLAAGTRTHPSPPSLISITSPLIQVSAGRSYVLTGYVRASRPDSTTTLQINTSFFRWAPARAVEVGAIIPAPSTNRTVVVLSLTTSVLSFELPHNPFDAKGLWEPLLVHVPAPSDASFASVTFGVAVVGECDPCPSVDLFAVALH